MSDLSQDIHACFLPAFGDLTLLSQVRRFLEAGCVAVLPGESRQEYVARKMSDARRSEETAAMFRELAEAARDLAGHPVLVAVDQELGGIERLHALVPPLPSASEAARMTEAEIAEAAEAVARGARGLGVNMFLSPIVDVVTGSNPWLLGRTVSADPAIQGRVAAAFVRGAQRAGVLCTAKHFPGHHDITGDPAIDASAVVTGKLDDLRAGYDPFHEVIAAGVKAIMTGPAPVPALDPDHAASTSSRVVSLLRDEFGFKGLVVSDDLDSAAVMRGRTVAQRAVDALKAGSDLLLVAGTEQLPDLARAVAEAVAEGRLSAARVAEAAARVRRAALATA